MSLAATPVETLDEDAEGAWTSYLAARIARDWRPGEFDAEALVFLPDIGNRNTRLTVCSKAGCGVLMPEPGLCPGCRKAWRETAPAVGYQDWLAQPRPVSWRSSA